MGCQTENQREELLESGSGPLPGSCLISCSFLVFNVSRLGAAPRISQPLVGKVSAPLTEAQSDLNEVRCSGRTSDVILLCQRLTGSE